jgi:vitamin K-dependent gamma-carboxylase
MYVVVAVTGGCGVVTASGSLFGLRTRAFLAAMVGGLVYLGAIDVAAYLNHYVLLVIVSACLVALPWGSHVEVSALWAVRAIVATTYGWAAVAKLNADWLSGRTIRPWLATHVQWPIIGDLFRYAATAQVLAVVGLIFDATIVGLLLWAPTRRLAFAIVVVFHLATAALFPIGMFPWIMIALTTVFFSPAWCERSWLGRSMSPGTSRRTPTVVVMALAILAALPARGYFSDVGWSEYGGRFAWRVMAVNKVAVAELVVRPADGGRAFIVRPERDLSPLQVQQVSWQPDLIMQWAHLVARIERQRLGVDVAVYADVWVSVGGRPPVQFIDPLRNLANEKWSIRRPSWVLAEPS